MEASNHRRMEVMAAPRKYPDEVRERAIRLVRDLVDNGEDGMSVTGACRRVGEQLGINTTRFGSGSSRRWSTTLSGPGCPPATGPGWPSRSGRSASCAG